MIGCSRISSLCMGIVNLLLLVKCRQGLSDCIKNSYCFVSVSFRICVCLNRTKPWLELSIKFNQYSIRSFQKTLVGLITFESISLLKSLIEYLCLKYISYPSKWRAKLGTWEVSFFCSSRRNFICFSQFPFWLILE